VSILIHKGVPVVRAVVPSLLTDSTAAVGALLVLLAGARSTGITTILLPFATANFLYIASSNLMPELRNETLLRPSLVQDLPFRRRLFDNLRFRRLVGTPPPFAMYGDQDQRLRWR